MAMESALGPLQMLGLAELKKKWAWFLGLGIALVILGTLALGAVGFTTLLAVTFFGYLLMVGGALETFNAFSTRRWTGFFVVLATGLLSIMVGFTIIANPTASIEALTLLLGFYFMAAGIIRIVSLVAVHVHHAGWQLLNGIVNLMLGTMIWLRWPESSYFIIGLFIAIDMIFNGWTLIMLALAAKNLPEHPVANEA